MLTQLTDERYPPQISLSKKGNLFIHIISSLGLRHWYGRIECSKEDSFISTQLYFPLYWFLSKAGSPISDHKDISQQQWIFYYSIDRIPTEWEYPFPSNSQRSWGVIWFALLGSHIYSWSNLLGPEEENSLLVRPDTCIYSRSWW